MPVYWNGIYNDATMFSRWFELATGKETAPVVTPADFEEALRFVQALLARSLFKKEPLRLQSRYMR